MRVDLEKRHALAEKNRQIKDQINYNRTKNNVDNDDMRTMSDAFGSQGRGEVRSVASERTQESIQALKDKARDAKDG